MPRHTTTRRKFLAAASATVAVPAFIPASSLGRDGRAAPSERITLAAIGWGLQGPGNTAEFLKLDDAQVVAVCDLDERHLEQGVAAVNSFYKNENCKGYIDYREVLARKDIDAVMIAVPDNWHGVLSVAAMRNGKDVYGEKPLAQTIAEQQAIVRTEKETNRIWQTGSWQRSVFNFRQAAELIRNGRIGKVQRVEVGLPPGHTDYLKQFKNYDGGPTYRQETTPPSHLHYDQWVGPAQMEPYIEARHHINWRWNYNIGGGNLMDWIGHHCDIAHWGLDFDHTGPQTVEGLGEFPRPDALWNTATKYRIACLYENDMELIIASVDRGDIRMGTKWIGADGWVYVDRGKFEASNRDWLRKEAGDEHQVKLTVSPGHYRQFIDCVKSRQPTLTPAEVAHRSATPGHLGYISMVLGRKIRWDSQTETILGDPAASRMLDRPLRSPWTI
jgi:predicted dehydrogenase